MNWDQAASFDVVAAGRRSASSFDFMTDYSVHWDQYRRLRTLTFVPLVGCFAYVVLLALGVITEPRRALWIFAGMTNLVCLLMFCYFGLKFSRLRCPRCGNYFLRGKKTYRSKAGIVCCRHCGLSLYSEV
jgi:hypothetical protein